MPDVIRHPEGARVGRLDSRLRGNDRQLHRIVICSKHGVYDPDRDRLRNLRASLFDRIEAHLKENTLPHVEIDLLAKMDRMLARQEAKVRANPALTTIIALETLLDDLQKHNPALKSQVLKHIPRIAKRISTRGYPDLMND